MSARPPGFRVAALGAVLALGGAWQAVVILVFLAAVLWAGEIAGVAVKAFRAAAKEVRELDRRRLVLEAAQARQAQAVAVPCMHWQAVPVRGVGGDVVAWLCTGCDAQLPADFGGLDSGT